MKKGFLLLVLLLSVPAFSQSLNDYQYVIVPIKFEVLKENDKYRLNTMTKLLLQKYNFKSYLSNEEIPDEVSNARCSVLTASLEKQSSMFITKVKIILKDCRDKVVYETELGTSREKEYAVAYNEALRAAFKSFDKVNHVYNGKNVTAPAVASTPVAPEAKTVETASQNGPATPGTPAVAETNPELFFFAQPITNGFQIVNSEPRVIMRIFNTSQKNVFIGVKEDTKGVVILKNNQWVFEYYESGKLVSEPLKIRF